MFYKVTPDTELCIKLQLLDFSIIRLKREIKEICDDIGAKNVVSGHHYQGKIEGFIFEEDPGENFKKVLKKEFDNAYMPKKKKANQELNDQLNDIKPIRINEYDKIIDFDTYKDPKSRRTCWGATFIKVEGVYFVRHPEYCDYKPVDGLVEILKSEYDAAVNELQNA